MTHVHIHAPKGEVVRRVLRCPSCKRRRRFVVVLYGWYGAMTTCCGCGEQWNDGYRAPRSRAKRQAWASQLWRTT